jgi:fibronectin type 3 domain-containing protein
LPFVLAAGQSVQVTATFAPAPGSPGTAAGTVTFASSVNSVASTLSGSGVANVMLSWAPDASANVTYSVYRCSVSLTACVQAQPANFMEIATGLGAPAYTDSSVSSGNSYYYALTATDTNNVQSSLSSVSSAVVIP